MSYDQAAERLCISSRTLRRAVAAGRAPHRRVGRLVRFTGPDVTEILASWRVAPQPRGSGPRTDG
ncbi:excisionase family DNA-binding protein [Saccharothrix tamanrassetensis]|uniref:excisionase family DNA-binding protein n=1 Tax=Saccharothrix tamanrassetensis TaxID=1051531 RepID=UPI001619B4DA